MSHRRPHYDYDYGYSGTGGIVSSSGGQSTWDAQTFVGVAEDPVGTRSLDTDHAPPSSGRYHRARRSAAVAASVSGELEFRPPPRSRAGHRDREREREHDSSDRDRRESDRDRRDSDRDRDRDRDRHHTTTTTTTTTRTRDRVRLRPTTTGTTTDSPTTAPRHHPTLRPSLSAGLSLSHLEKESLKLRLGPDPRLLPPPPTVPFAPLLSDGPPPPAAAARPRARSLSLSRHSAAGGYSSSSSHGTTLSGGSTASTSVEEEFSGLLLDAHRDEWGMLPPAPGAPASGQFVPPPPSGGYGRRLAYEYEYERGFGGGGATAPGTVVVGELERERGEGLERRFGGRRRRRGSFEVEEGGKGAGRRRGAEGGSPGTGGAKGGRVRGVSKYRAPKQQYNQVHALILTWSFHDLRAEDYTAPPPADYVSLEQETARLRGTLEGYGYAVHEFLIPMHRSAESLKAKLKQFCRYAADDTLLVVYYHGHGALDEENELVFSSHDHPETPEWSKAAAAELYAALLTGDACPTHGRQERYNELLKKYERYRPISTLQWDLLRTPLLSAPCDVLLVLDCCAAGGANLRHLGWRPPPGTESYTKHLFAACGFESSTSSDMTAAMCEVLDERACQSRAASADSAVGKKKAGRSPAAGEKGEVEGLTTKRLHQLMEERLQKTVGSQPIFKQLLPQDPEQYITLPNLRRPPPMSTWDGEGKIGGERERERERRGRRGYVIT